MAESYGGGEDEVARMVARLVGDSTKYIQMLEEAEHKTSEAGEHVKEAGKEIESIGGHLEGFASAAVGALTTLAEFHFLKEAYSDFSKLETAQVGLTAAIESNGHAVEKTMEDYKEFAEVMEQHAAMSKLETLALLRKVETYNLSGAAAKTAAQNAVSLGAIEGQSAERFIRITAAVESGNVKLAMHMARLVPQLRGVKDEHEFLAKYQKLVADGFEASGKLADTSAGRMKQLGIAFEELRAGIGKTVADVVAPLVSWLTKVIKGFAETPPWIKQVVVGLIALSAAWAALNVAMTITGGPVVWVAALAAGIVVLTGLIMDMKNASEESAKEMHRQWSEGLGKNVQESITFSASLDTSDLKIATLERERSKIAELSKQYERVKDLDEERAQAAKEAGDQELFEAYTRSAEKYGKQVDAVTQQMDLLDSEIKKIQHPEANEEVHNELTKFIDKLTLEADTLGMTGQEVELYRLKQKGLTDEYLRGQNTLGRNGAGVDIVGKISEVAAGKIDLEIKKLQQEYDTLGMTAGAKKAYEAATKGATDAQQQLIEQLSRDTEVKKYVMSLQDEIETLGMSEEGKKLYKIATQGATDAELKFAAQLEHTAEIGKKAQELSKKYADPIDAYAQSVNDLTEMLDKHLITQDVYDKAMDDAAKAYDKASQAAQGAAASVKDLNAAAAGSADANARIAEYTSRIKGQVDVSVSRPNLTEQQRANNRDVLMEIRDALKVRAGRPPLEVQVSDLS